MPAKKKHIDWFKLYSNNHLVDNGAYILNVYGFKGYGLYLYLKELSAKSEHGVFSVRKKDIYFYSKIGDIPVDEIYSILNDLVFNRFEFQIIQSVSKVKTVEEASDMINTNIKDQMKFVEKKRDYNNKKKAEEAKNKAETTKKSNP